MNRRLLGWITCVKLSVLLIMQAAYAETLPPMADIHIHYNWNQAEVIDADEVVSILKQHDVKLAVVSSRPSAMALELRQAGGDWILPFFSPYIRPGIKKTWFIHPEVVVEARKALASGQYFGLGEMHLVPGMGPRRDNKVVQGLLSLAREFDVPILIHTDSSSHTYLQPICQQYHDVRIVWAHAGGLLQPDEVGPLMEKCPNVWVELSARDPWHYGNFIDGDGEFFPGWYDLFVQYPKRFMTGTDPVWNAHQTYRWYEADEGWNNYGKLNRFHRDWMSKLPAKVEQSIRYDNARRFYLKQE